MTLFIALAFLLILGSLATALLYLLKDTGKIKRTVKALTLRISFSIILFIFILWAYYFGYISPGHPPYFITG